MEEGLFILLIILVSVFFMIALRKSDSKKSFRSVIEPQLKEHNLKYISEEDSGLNTGPFPSVEIKIGAPQIRIFGMNMERSVYRIVTIENSNGNQGEIWAKIDLSGIFKPKVEFRPPLNEVSRI